MGYFQMLKEEDIGEAEKEINDAKANLKVVWEGKDTEIQKVIEKNENLEALIRKILAKFYKDLYDEKPGLSKRNVPL